MSKGKSRTRNINNRKKIEEVISDDSPIMDKFFIVAGVILFLLCFYILTVYITNKHKDTDTDKEKVVEISKDKIILGRSLSMGKGDYFVIYYESNDSTTYDEIVKNYSGELPIYKVDMSSAFNKKYITSEESNKNPTKVSEFKINGPTLIKVSNKKVVDYIEGEEQIRTILN
ncbi:MAG: hypothetical protein IK137_00475 [Bacilli bacterium]|nr:hypothetical protein [Bacilli bacterium]